MSPASRVSGFWLPIVFAIALAAWFGAGGAVPSRAAGAADKGSRNFESTIRPILETHCFSCHGPKKQKGGIDFSRVSDQTSILRARKLWRQAIAQLESQAMPPRSAAPLPDEQRKQLVQWMSEVMRPLAVDDPANRNPGPAPSRRLTVAEYDNTVRDLLGVDFSSADEVGSAHDPEGERFGVYGNLAATLVIPQSGMDKYFVAADKILDRFFGTEPRSGTDGRVKERARRARERLFGLKNGSWSDPAKAVVAPPPGRPRRGAAQDIIAGVLHRAFRRPVEDREVEQYLSLHDLAASKGMDYVASIRLLLKAVLVSPHFLYRVERDRPGAGGAYRASDHELAVRLSYFLWSSMPDDWLLELADRNLLTAENPAAETVRLRGVAIGRGTPRTPYEDAFDGSVETFFEAAQPDGAWVGLDLLEPRELRKLRFAPRPGFEGRMVGGRFQASNNAQFESGVVDLATVAKTPAAGWSSLDLNIGGKYRFVRYLPPKGAYGNLAEMELYGLLGGAVFDQQVRRMLAAPKARALTDNFGARWLKLNKLPFAHPLTEVFTEFWPHHRSRMYDESAMFFDMLRKEDRSLLELIDADYTYLDEELAKYYRIPDVKGKDFRRVQLKPEYHRGGLLGMGSVMVLTSHASRTSPTLRGKYVLEVLLGQPPPPPPPDVGEISGQKKGEKVSTSLREKLTLHANSQACMGCHRKMDPLGFALENFNAVGLWREKDGPLPLDTSGVLPDGEKISGVEDLKRVLLKHQDDFARNAATQALIYALGREPDYYDDFSIEQIAARLKADNIRFSALVLGVVHSYPFRYRSNVDVADD